MRQPNADRSPRSARRIRVRGPRADTPPSGLAPLSPPSQPHPGLAPAPPPALPPALHQTTADPGSHRLATALDLDLCPVTGNDFLALHRLLLLAFAEVPTQLPWGARLTFEPPTLRAPPEHPHRFSDSRAWRPVSVDWLNFFNGRSTRPPGAPPPVAILDLRSAFTALFPTNTAQDLPPSQPGMFGGATDRPPVWGGHGPLCRLHTRSDRRLPLRLASRPVARAGLPGRPRQPPVPLQSAGRDSPHRTTTLGNRRPPRPLISPPNPRRHRSLPSVVVACPGKPYDVKDNPRPDLHQRRDTMAAMALPMAHTPRSPRLNRPTHLLTPTHSPG